MLQAASVNYRTCAGVLFGHNPFRLKICREIAMSCRYCQSNKTQSCLSFEKWLAAAKESGDERSRMAELVAADPRLGFGDIMQCRECGFLSVEKIPDGQALDDFYRAYYANSSYGTKETKKIRRSMRRVSSSRGRIKGNRFLDIGCNLGFAVEAAGCSGMEAYGIDVDEQAVDMAKKRFTERNFELVSVQDFAARGEKFDLVFCTEVIEHLPDFHSFAKALSELVAKDGLLFLTTPDAGHWLRPRKLTDWREVKPPEHLQWFGKKHLKKMFESSGLEVRFQFNWKPGIRMVAKG